MLHLVIFLKKKSSIKIATKEQLPTRWNNFIFIDLKKPFPVLSDIFLNFCIVSYAGQGRTFKNLSFQFLSKTGNEWIGAFCVLNAVNFFGILSYPNLAGSNRPLSHSFTLWGTLFSAVFWILKNGHRKEGSNYLILYCFPILT